MINESILFAGANDSGIYRSSGYGQNWIKINDGLTNKSINVFFAAVNNSADTLIFVGTFGGGVFVSTNNGNDWNSANTGITNQNIRAFVSINNDISGTILFAGTDQGVFRSSNYGSSWTAINNGLINSTIVSLQTYNGFILAGTTGGVFISKNMGEKWDIFNTGMANAAVYSIVIKGDYLLAGTEDDFVWKRPVSDLITGTNIKGSIPLQFNLFQNYPNPFNPTTNICYSLTESGNVKLKIFDTLGREIKTLVDSFQNAGEYFLTWDAFDEQNKRVSSGVYLYKLEAGNQNFFKKMILLH